MFFLLPQQLHFIPLHSIQRQELRFFFSHNIKKQRNHSPLRQCRQKAAMTSLLSLPTELQLQILTHLVDSLDEAPSETNFDQEPSYRLERSSKHILKNLSLVCSELRQLVLPALFEYACVKDLEPSDHLLRRAISSGVFDGWSSGNYFCEILYISIQAFIDFMTSRGLQSSVKSLVVCIYRSEPESWNTLTLKSCPMASQCAIVWDLIFENLPLTRFVLAGAPNTMFTLLTTRLPNSGLDFRSLRSRPGVMQYLGLQCEIRERIEVDTKTGRSRGEALWKRRPWTHFSFNEGGLNMARFRKIFNANQPGRELRSYAEQELLLLQMRLEFTDHSPFVLQILEDLGEQMNSGSKINNLYFISSFPNRQFLDRVLQQKGLEKIRHWRTKLAQRELFKEMQITGSFVLTKIFFEHWQVLHSQLYGKLLVELSARGHGGSWLSSDQLNGCAWGFLKGEFRLESAETFPPGRTLWTFQ